VYDSIYWYKHFSDGATFEHGRALSQLTGTIVMRVADADVLPFEFGNLADTLGRYSDDLEKLARRGPSDAHSKIDLGPMQLAVRSLAESAKRYEAAFGRAGARGFAGIKDLKALNKLIYQSERKLTSDKGLPRRPWFVHELYAPGFYTGYGVKT